jgi:anti-sigma regulatory factor (Ser/Thr protein kinase)
MLIPVREESQVSQSCQKAVGLARELQLTEQQVGKVAMVATEIATNLIKHARQGEFSATIIEERAVPSVELLSVDAGPGIADIQRVLTGRSSSNGTAETGLPAVRRLSDRFAIHSKVGAGTVLMARLTQSDPPEDWNRLEVGAVIWAMPGERVSGDAWAFRRHPTGGVLMVADGLGHGPDAAAAAQEAVRVMREGQTSSPTRLAEDVHRALAGTRGAAIGIADIDVERKQVAFVGLGNISACVVAGGASCPLVSHYGTAGVTAPRIAEFCCPLTMPSIVILHSDGVSPRWQIGDYPGLEQQHPSIIAGVVHRDFRRGRDDAAVAVAKVLA